MPGQDWKHELYNAIESCEAFVYNLTSESVASEWCQWEFAEAIKMGKPVVPILLRQAEIPENISAFQYVDFTTGPTPHNVAKVMGGLTVIVANQPRNIVPGTIQNPVGIPAQATNADIATKVITPSELLSLPSPFDLCEIPSGKVNIINDNNNFKLPTFHIKSFWIAKYPITNNQYWLFTNARDGYVKSQWWDFSVHAKAWRETHPDPLETAFSGHDLPRTNVTWYEALAFCRWLTVKVDNKWIIRLPTEQEWQWAAQGQGYLAYPWGNDFNSQNANTFESDLRQPTPVTRYKAGRSPFDVMDMSGNVLEWCQTVFDKPHVNYWDNDHQRVLRGGSFGNDEHNVTTTFRGRALPNMHGNDIGFRIVCISTESQ